MGRATKEKKVKQERGLRRIVEVILVDILEKRPRRKTLQNKMATLTSFKKEVRETSMKIAEENQKGERRKASTKANGAWE